MKSLFLSLFTYAALAPAHALAAQIGDPAAFSTPPAFTFDDLVDGTNVGTAFTLGRVTFRSGADLFVTTASNLASGSGLACQPARPPIASPSNSVVL